MDLKSMLNDSATQRPPRLHTPHSSYDARADHTPASDRSSSRQTPYPPPLQSIDSRGQSASSYFALQSPHPNTSTAASTPSVSNQSIYAQSPGPYTQSYTPRESLPPSTIQNAPLLSPSPSLQYPVTPGSVHHQHLTPISTHPQSAHTPSHSHFQSPIGHPSNGASTQQGRQISPTAQYHTQSATPLGPPVHHPRLSPQAHRPSSQGRDQHRRKTSYSSVSSVHSKDYSHPGIAPSDSVRRDSAQHSAVAEVREREKSVSVSPKTIPRASPFRQMSTGSTADSRGRASLSIQPEHHSKSGSNAAMEPPPDVQHQSSTPGSSMIKSEHNLHHQNAYSRPNPTPLTHSGHTPQLKHEELPGPTGSPRGLPQGSLKRSASHISDSSVTQPAPRKRTKRGEMPIWAQAARTKGLRFMRGGLKAQATSVPRTQPHIEPSVPPPTNGQPTEQPSVEPEGLPWEASIANVVPFQDLTRFVCDWVFNHIGLAAPPSGGAMFEIEAKIGQIVDTQTQARLFLPVMTETIINRDAGLRSKFESSMNVEQHRALNEYLNSLVRESMIERSEDGRRQEILFAHPKENDEFYELTPEGMEHLPASIVHWIDGGRRTKPRVRRTIDKTTGQLVAQIIKTRIADLDIYNPRSQFDYRVSISIESPWHGNENWLRLMSEGNNERNKDRMSYRHMAYQVDLTQVTHTNKPDKEHELEVEISVEQIRRELDNARAKRPNRYEDLIQGLMNNVRLLCRKGTVNMGQ